MKKIKYLLLGLFSLFVATSCEDYLTVNPKTQVTQDLFFNSETGFKDALTGVYIQMKSVNAYGEALTMTTVDQLISNWDVTANTTQQRLGLYNYTDANVQSTMATIFGQEYKIISSINAILAQIDIQKDVFSTPEMYQMIKGECIALRAYCHFDVLRLFGPIPSVTTDVTILPYVTTLSKNPNPQLSYSDFKAQVLKDLTDAAELLKADPIVTNNLNYVPLDNYMVNRFLRMNYYAVRALQARAYLWFNDPANAYASAKEVIDAKNTDGTLKFRLGVAADMTAKDFALTCEQIFGLYDWTLYSRYNSLFANGTLKKGSAETTVKTQLYGNTGTDIREASLWTLITQPNQAKTYVYNKYQVAQATASTFPTDFKRIPMLRLSELYLIAAETAPNAEAQTYWTAFRTARNITTATLPTDLLMLQAALLPEYRKEFFAEGQAFFAYKRVNAAKASVLWTPTAATINYVVPLPLSELVKTY